MQNGEVIVFKVYSDFSIKKLFKMEFHPDEAYYKSMNKLRNRLIHRRQNVGNIYVVRQGRFGLLMDKYLNGIPQDGWGEDTQGLSFEHLEYVIKITNRNKPIKADWIKIRK